MLFTTLEFGLFIAVLTVVYYLVPRAWQWKLLLLASLAFYAGLGRRRIVFVLASCVCTWVCALWLDKLHGGEKAQLAREKETLDRAGKKAVKQRWLRRRRAVLGLFVLFNFGLLFTFKFYNMAARAASGFLPKLDLLMPIGISFYTLQITGYILDVYHKKVCAERSLAKTALFTTFFPQIIEGPISRFDQLAPQLLAQHPFDYDRFVRGCERILWGCFKKLVIADRLNIPVTTVFGAWNEYQGFTIAAAAVMYTIQLYADFSGGIDIACGVAEVLGIDLAENFKRPFFSKSVSEFWRRWHITLGAWLRDYVFYPLTLSKPLAKMGKWCTAHLGKWAGKWLPAYCSLFVLWLCNGIWHGEGAQYIVFGLYHGVLIMLGMTFEPLYPKLCSTLHIDRDTRTFQIFRVARTFALVVLGEMIFRSASLADAAGMFGQLCSAWNPWVLFDGTLLTLGLDGKDFAVAVLGVAVLLCASLAARSRDLRAWLMQRELPLRWGVWLLGILAIAVFGVYGPGYDPTPFIYFQF